MLNDAAYRYGQLVSTKTDGRIGTAVTASKTPSVGTEIRALSSPDSGLPTLNRQSRLKADRELSKDLRKHDAAAVTHAGAQAWIGQECHVPVKNWFQLLSQR